MLILTWIDNNYQQWFSVTKIKIKYLKCKYIKCKKGHMIKITIIKNSFYNILHRKCCITKQN